MNSSDPIIKRGNLPAIPGSHRDTVRKVRKTTAEAIANGSPEFKAYAAYILESRPNTTLPALREFFKHNASIREIEAHEKRLKDQK